MIRRTATIIIALSAFVLFSVPAMAQMSDDAVYAYVEDGLASGKSQQAIVKELAARGVTKAQAERIKKRIEDMHGTTDAVRSVDTQERSRRSNSGVNAIGAGDMDIIVAEMGAGALADSTAVAVDSTLVFGRNIFSNRNLTFAPSDNLATPENYKLGPGDEVIIDIWGTNQNTIRQTISPDGFINIEGIGLVYLTGMTVKEADSYMRRQLNRIYSVDGEGAQSDIKLTLGAIRTIQVNVMGEVKVPGTYFLSSLSTIYHALYRAGGFSDLGSVRNIELIRDGAKKVTVDVYDFIVKGQSPDDVTLQEGDIILVPPYESLVDITGNVKRPMIYEMKDGETIDDLLGYAGGFTGNAYKPNIRMIRQNGREYQVYTILEDEYPTFKVMDGDAVTVGAMLDRYENRLEIKGAVYRPGIYQFSDKIHTVKQLVSIADGLKGDAFTNRAIIHREREDLTLEVLSFDLKKVLSGEVADIELKPNDVLLVSSIHDLQDVGFITVNGEVAKPGSFVFAENNTIEDIIIQAGGLLESASTVKVDVSRRIKNPQATESSDTLARIFTFSVKDGFVVEGDENFVLQPYDVVYVRRSPSYNTQNHVRVEGEVLFPGMYALESKSARLSDLVGQCGGVSKFAYTKGARLSRRMTPEERTRMQSTLDMLDNARDSVDFSKIDVAETYFVGIDLEAALANPGSDADILLRDGDVLLVPEYLNTVKISGNVLYPNVVTYNSSMTVKDYVQMAGGYGFRAKRSKAYIVYINGTVARAKKLSRSVVQPGCEIIVPEKQKNEDSLQKILSVATTSSSIATMLATIYNIIR
ncbi:MAG: SLBB domain-containing protein [Bacteroidales bacterium]|nr:SLBB domain-containing protein [Bacteroidales bacterium]MBQ8811337.1 SLBB domain-containing protein [Bacteroidales bacterium]